MALEISTTEPGDSSTATGNGNSLMSRIFGDSEPRFSNGGLTKVPDHLRKLDEQAFTPQLISIGPIHRSNPKLQTMKECKVRFCKCFIQRANINFEDLVHTIKDKEEEIRSYYAEIVVSSISSDDFVTMILVDGVFIFEYILRQSYPHLDKYDHMIAKYPPQILIFDLVLLENQLPFLVLETLDKQAIFPPELGIKPLKELAFKFFQCYNFQKIASKDFNVDKDEFKDRVRLEHFTDLVRFFYLDFLLPERIFGGAKLSYSAIQLHEAGVKFKGVEFDEEEGFYRGGKRFLEISFDFKNGVLEIPCVKLNDEKIRLIRNIIALEQSHYVGHAYVTDFFIILDFLIDSSKDVDLLCDKGILINYLGDNKVAASAVNNLNTNILLDYMNSDYSKICEDLNAFYKKPWHRWRAMLWRQYFSTPWRATSTSAAIILLVLTAIQTVCSLKSTKW